MVATLANTRDWNLAAMAGMVDEAIPALAVEKSSFEDEDKSQDSMFIYMAHPVCKTSRILQNCFFKRIMLFFKGVIPVQLAW